MDRDGARKHVVVIDDAPDILALVQTIVEEKGWSMVGCGDRTHALHCIHAERPDVILLDLCLPAADMGWDMLRALQSTPSIAHIPVILFTADRWAVEGRDGWLDGHAVTVLLKPFDLDDFDRALDAAPSAVPPVAEDQPA
jgi:CheY-like chemotaxis protein